MLQNVIWARNVIKIETSRAIVGAKLLDNIGSS